MEPPARAASGGPGASGGAAPSGRAGLRGLAAALARVALKSGLRVALLIALGTFVLHGYGEWSLLQGKPAGFLQLLERTALDVKLVWRGPRPPARWGVVVVAADERAVQRLGRLPWSRETYARLVERLSASGARAIGFDVTFEDAAPVPPPPLAVVDRLEAAVDAERREAGPEADAALERLAGALADARAALVAPRIAPEDRAFADAAAASGRVVLGVVARSDAEARDVAPEVLDDALMRVERSLVLEPLQAGLEGGFDRPLDDPSAVFRSGFVYRFGGLVAPTATLAASAASFGLLNARPDVDGVYRRMPLVAAIRGVDALVPGLALAAVAVAVDAPIEVFADAETGDLTSVRVGEHTLQLELGGLSTLDWYGPFVAEHLPIVSAVDVIDGRVPDGAIDGRVALVAATAVGTYDQRVTPFGTSVPGVATHATLVQNLLDGRQLLRPRWILALELVAFLALGVVLGLALPRFGPAAQIGVAALVAAAWIAVDAYVTFPAGLWLHVVVPLAQIGVTLVGTISWRLLVEERERQQTRQAFSRYLSPRVLEKVLESPEEYLRLGGRRAEATVLFSDIRGFTTFSETLSPEALGHLLNLYLTPMTELVLESGGTLDKFIGDAVMAFWGAPIPQPDHALRAARTALAMLARVEALNVRLRAEGLPPIAIGVGLSSGPMTIGNMGSEGLFAYTAIGDRVNLGARLEGQTKDYGVSALMSEATWREVHAHVGWRELGSLRVKGKNEGVRVFELVAPAPLTGEAAAFVDAFHRGLAAYRARQWDAAEAAFRAALDRRPDDKSTQLYLDELPGLRAAPPPDDWDGTRTAKAK